LIDDDDDDDDYHCIAVTERSHCVSLHSSFDECRMMLDGCRPLTNLGCETAVVCIHHRRLLLNWCTISSHSYCSKLHTSGNSSIDTSLICDICRAREVSFETCVAVQFMDDDDDELMMWPRWPLWLLFSCHGGLF